MADKTASLDDTIKLIATTQGKQPTDFGVQSFKNVDGGHSVAIVNTVTGGVVQQANAENEKAAQEKLAKANEGGLVTHVDGHLAPEEEGREGQFRPVGPAYGSQETKVYGGSTIPAQDQPEAVRTNEDVVRDLPKNDNGQVVINSDGFVEGLKAKDQPAGAGQAPKAAEAKDSSSKA